MFGSGDVTSADNKDRRSKWEQSRFTQQRVCDEHNRCERKASAGCRRCARSCRLRASKYARDQGVNWGSNNDAECCELLGMWVDG
jgi:hypothetical protein